jgi:regulator of replication initiation timing
MAGMFLQNRYERAKNETEDVSFENPERRLKIMEKQLEAMAEQIKRLKDENEALRLDLGLKVHGL